MRPTLAATCGLAIATATGLVSGTARAADPAPPAYELRADRDVPVIAATATIDLSWFLLRDQIAGPYCAPVCDRSTVNAFDRWAAGRWFPGWGTASDVGLASIAAGSAAVLLVDEGLGPGLSDAVVVAESALVGDALAVTSEMSVRRPRPFVYDTKAPLENRTSGGAALSFFSGHTTGAFALSTSLFVTTWRLHPRGALPWVVLGVGLSAASFVGATRVLKGDHFPTDVIAGALVGSSAGVLVPSLHGAPFRVLPMGDERTRGVALVGAF